MSPNKKRSTSPTAPPSWLKDMMEAHQEALRVLNGSLNEIRANLIALQTTFLRDRVRPTSGTAPAGNQRAAPPTTSGNSSRAVAGPSMEPHGSPHVSRSLSRSGAQRRSVSSSQQPAVASSQAGNRSARSAAPRTTSVHPPRTTEGSRDLCWFHRQFGMESKKCLEPCRLAHLVAPGGRRRIQQLAPHVPEAGPSTAIINAINVQLHLPANINASNNSVDRPVDMAVDNAPVSSESSADNRIIRVPLERSNSVKRSSTTSTDTSDDDPQPSSSKALKA